MLTNEVIEKIYFICKQYWGDTELAEDIAHDTFEALLKWPPKEDLNDVRMGFFKTIVFRYARQQNGGHTKDHNHSRVKLDPEHIFIEVTTSNPEKELLNKEVISLVQYCIGKLKPKQKKAITLRFYEDKKIQKRSLQVSAVDAQNKLKKDLRGQRIYSNSIYTIKYEEENA